MNNPRTLVISNNSFSKTSSNGRTLGSLFTGWPKDRLAQFCISTTTPDYDLCDNYFLLTDRSILEGFKHLRKGKRCTIEKNIGTEGNTVVGGKKVFKTPLKALLRHFIWNWKRWNSNEFQEWLDDFRPNIIVVMNSDATFILDIATYVSKKRNIPLVMYNTEGFYFFKHNYFNQSRLLNGFFFNVYQNIYKKRFKEMMRGISLSFHLNSLLRDDFKKEFDGEHEVLYTSSSLKFDNRVLNTDSPVFSYLGNFGFDRPSALVEVAEVLQSINPGYKLDVYGKIPRQEVRAMFDNCPGINYRGMISYEEVIRVMYSSTILFHAEVQLAKYEESLRYGFSTKIADSISCGHPFLIYSSQSIAGAKYLLETGAGWHAKNKSELKEKILLILGNVNERNKVLDVAKEVAKKNHNVARNAKIFRELLCSLANGE